MMFQVGSYEIINEVSRSPHALLYAARTPGNAADKTGQFAVKVVDTESYALLESFASGMSFLDSAKLQYRLASQGGHHWAKVLELGDVDNPYYVSEMFPLTAKRVVDRQAFVGERGLYTIVWSVVRGLTELRESYRRAHGNLKLTNILIGGDVSLQSPSQTRVVLCDPAAEASGARDRSADLQAIGELIYQLVLLRPFKSRSDDMPVAAPEFPIPESSAWTKLGSNGLGWLDLCNWLLSPKPADRPSDLVEVAVALHALTPRGRRISKKWIAAAVTGVLLAAGGVATFWTVHSGVREEAIAAEPWLSQLTAGASDPVRSKRWAAADPSLRDLADALTTANAGGVHLNVADDSILSYSAYQNAKAVRELARRADSDLAPDRWKTLSAMTLVQQRYTERGWSQPANYLARLTSEARPAASSDLSASIDHLIDASARLRVDGNWLDEAWAKLDADLRTVEATGDPAMAPFARRLRDAVGSSLRLTDAGFEGTDALKDRLPLAAQLARLVAGGWPGDIDRARLASDVDARINLLDPREDEIKRWLGEIESYRLVKLDEKAEPLAGLGSAFDKVVGEIARQSFTKDDQQEYDAERQKIQAKIQSLKSSRFLKKDLARNQGEAVARVAELQRDLDSLRKQWVRLDSPQQWTSFIDQPLSASSDILKARWTQYVARQKSVAVELAKNPEAFKSAKAEAAAVRSALGSLDGTFPLGIVGLNEPFLSLALTKREQILGQLSSWAAPASGPVVMPEAAVLNKQSTAAGETFLAWTAKLAELGKDFPIATELLNIGDRPDQRWAERSPEFWQDPLIQSVVKSDVARIAAVNAVAKMSRAELIAAVGNTPSAEVAVAGYRQLGVAVADQPVWPTEPADLTTDAALRTRVEAFLKGIKSDTDRRGPLEEFRQQGPARWRRFMNLAVASGPSDTGAAVDRRIRVAIESLRGMGVGPNDAEQLDPPARFNLALFRARVVVTDPVSGNSADPVVRATADSLARAASALPDHPELGRLLRRLPRIGDAEPMSGDPLLLAPQPPETYTLTVGGKVTLNFVRVAAPGLRPAYICTTELSLAQFIDLVNSGGNWPTANALLGNIPSPPETTAPVAQRGPRAWDRPTSAEVAIDRFPDTWRYDSAERPSQEFAFAEALRVSRFNRKSIKPEAGDNPRYDHPMQQLPAQAAVYAAGLAGCRLPSLAEWQAAYELDRKAAPDAANPPNLLDQTWATQSAFASTHPIPQWPDPTWAGVQRAKVAAQPFALRPEDDRILFFRSVGVGGGALKNMVGNVAELVCDSIDGFDALADRKSADAIARLCKSADGKMLAVGGSAFTPAQTDPLTPIAVESSATPFADVGVRLAFTAPSRTTAERLKWILEEQRYLAAKSAK